MGKGKSITGRPCRHGAYNERRQARWQDGLQKVSPMQIPDVRSTIVDRERDITYHIMAYRPLTREEMALSLRQYWAQKGSLKVERGSTVTIVSVIGDND